jgi:hypothetical protein
MHTYRFPTHPSSAGSVSGLQGATSTEIAGYQKPIEGSLTNTLPVHLGIVGCNQTFLL